VNRKLFLSLLFVFVALVSLGGSQSASAQVNLTLTPYQTGAFQAYPGGSTADNVFVLNATGPDSYSGMNITITGPNASSFQQDGNVTPACFSFNHVCAWGIYFQAPTTPGPYTATLTATYTDTTTNVNGSATYALVGNVVAAPTPSGSPNLSFVPPTTVFAGVPNSFGYSGNAGAANLAKLSAPADIVFDTAGNAYIADKQNYVVRKVDPTGIITVYAGTPSHGGVGSYTGEGGAATSATLQGPVSLALDKAGNLYIGDGFTTVLVVNAATQKISTYAGSTTYNFGYSGDGGPATSALLYGANSLAFDSKGNLYILETKSGDIRKVDTSGNISTYAGKNQFYNNASGHTPNFEGFSGDGGPAASATFYQPSAIAIDAADNIYVSDDSDRIRKINATTTVITTIAGLGASSPYQTAAQTGTESTPALQAEFYGGAVTVDPAGNIYIADSLPVASVNAPGTILKVDSTGTVTAYPSTGGMAYAGYLRTDSAGALYIMDQVTSVVYKVGAQGALAFGNENVGSTTPAQMLTLQNNGSSAINFNTTPYTIAGDFGIGDSGTCSFSAPLAVGATCTVAVNFAPKSPGMQSGTITFASNSITNPLVANVTGFGVGAALVPQGVLSTPLAFTQTVNTTSNAQVIMLSNPGNGPLTISSIALGGTNSTNFGLNASACPVSPATLGIGASCNITVNFTPALATSYSATLTVTDNATAGTTQSVTLNGTGIAAVASVAQLQLVPAQLNLFAGTYPSGCGDTGDGAPATQAVLCAVGAVAVDAAGNTYVVDQSENTVRKVDTSGNISTFAGAPVLSNVGTFSGDGGPAATAGLSQPIDVAVDASGNVYISDYENGRIREVSATTSKISTFVGGASGFFNGGTGTGVAIGPTGIAFDPFGNLYIADDNQQIIVKVTPTGSASLFAGVLTGSGPGVPGYNGDNILAINAELNFPAGVASDAAGNIYIADTNNCRIRKVAVGTGMITTVAGNGTCGNTGDNASAISAQIRANSVSLDLAGDILLSNGVTLRKVDINGNITTIAGGGTASGTYGIPATEAAFNGGVNISRVDNNGNLLMPVRTSGYQVVKAGPNGALDFGSSVVNTPTAAQIVTFENTGNTTLTLAPTTYTASGDFSVTGGTCVGTATLAPGITCTLTVVFTPTTTGARAGQISVGSNSSSGEQTIFLTGNGTPAVAVPTATLSQGSDFGMVTDGTTSPSQTFTLFNTSSTATLSNISISIAGATPTYFAETTTCQSTLAASSNCNIFVTFSPTAPINFTASLIVTDNASPTTQTAPLTGTGIAAALPPTLTPPIVTFTPVAIGSGDDSIFVTLTNPGSTPLTGIVQTFTGPNASEFSTYPTGTCTTTLAATSSCTYAVRFYPTGTGLRTAIISVAQSGTTTPLTATLNGTGLPALSGQLGFVPAQLNAIAGTGTAAAGCNDTGDGGAALQATFCKPYATATDLAGNIYVVDQGDNIVKKIDTSGNITTFAGVANSGTGTYGGDGGQATSANLNAPTGIAVDVYGDVFIADTGNNRIREVMPSGVITTFVGGASGNFNGGTGTAVALNMPDGIALDASSNLYIADTAQQIIVEVTPAGVATLFAGVQATPGGPGTAGYNNDNIPANTAELNNPQQVAVDRQGSVYIADTGNNRIRQVFNGTITTLAGNGTKGDTGDGASSTLAEIGAVGVAVDLAENYYISDGTTVRKVNESTGIITTVAGGGSGGIGGAGNTASLSGVGFLSVDNAGNVLIPVSGAPQILSEGSTGFLQFGSQTLNTTTAPLTETVLSVGDFGLFFKSTSYTATGDFAVTGGTCQSQEGPGTGGCSIIVTFTPTTTGLRTGSITVPVGGGGSGNGTILLRGTGAAVTTPIAAFSAPSLTYTTVVNTAAYNQTVMLSNTGTAALNIASIAITGPNQSSFTIITNGCSMPVAAGSSCSVTVGFPIIVAGTYTATLTATDNASPTTQSVALSGTVTAPLAPVVSLTPNPLAFGNITVGTTSGTLQVTVSDTGTGGLQFNGITIGGANPSAFKQSTGSCDGSIGTGSTCTYGFTFTPPSAGNFSATVSVTDNAGDSPQTITLTGTGVAAGTDYTVTATNPRQSVQAGGVAQFNINVAALSGSYNTPVVLTVTGLPAGTTASFNPATVTPGSTGATSVLSVQTPSLTSALKRDTNNTWLALLLLPLLGTRRLRRKLRRMPLAALLLAALALGAVTGCGGGYFSPQPQTVTLTVTGTSGPLTHSTTVTLTIQ
jgi:sugar lactone lactonase YvrE